MDTKTNKVKKIKMTIPKSRSKNAPTQKYISVNGESYLIKLGEEVEVPDYIYQAYLDSEGAKDKAFDNIQNVQDKMPTE